MEKYTKKCSLNEHSEIDATFYCLDCKIYMCNKCESFHSKLLKNHHIFNLTNDFKEIFTGFCQIEKHSNELKYFCKTHNQLCCAACISKIQDKEYGQHKECDVCNIHEIKEEKRTKLKSMNEYLENLFQYILESINELKIVFIDTHKNKEELKKKIQNIFTKIRSAFNEREDQLLLEIEQKYNNILFKEEFIKEAEKLPNQIKSVLEKGKMLYNRWNKEDNNLYSSINNCINIENNIKDINKVLNEIKKYNSKKYIVKFMPEDNAINNLMKTIKSFGSIYYEDNNNNEKNDNDNYNNSNNNNERNDNDNKNNNYSNNNNYINNSNYINNNNYISNNNFINNNNYINKNNFIKNNNFFNNVGNIYNNIYNNNINKNCNNNNIISILNLMKLSQLNSNNNINNNYQNYNLENNNIYNNYQRNDQYSNIKDIPNKSEDNNCKENDNANANKEEDNKEDNNEYYNTDINFFDKNNITNNFNGKKNKKNKRNKKKE